MRNENGLFSRLLSEKGLFKVLRHSDVLITVTTGDWERDPAEGRGAAKSKETVGL